MKKGTGCLFLPLLLIGMVSSWPTDVAADKGTDCNSEKGTGRLFSEMGTDWFCDVGDLGTDCLSWWWLAWREKGEKGTDSISGWLAPVSVFAASAGQAEQPPEELEPKGYVNDFAGVMSAGSASALDSFLEELDGRTGAQLSVVTVPGLGGAEIRDFSNRLFERWGIGHQDNRGLLMLAAVQDRRIWVEVGYGLEPLLPDARVGRVLDETVVPFFRTGDYTGGLVSGARAFAGIIARDSGVELSGLAGVADSLPSGSPAETMGCGETIFFVVLMVAVVILFIRHPWLLWVLLSFSSSGGSGGSGGFGGGGFGGFGGGSSGGGGAGRGW